MNIWQNRFCTILIAVRNGNENYQLQSGEKIILGIKASVLNTSYLLLKELTSADFDTENGGYIATLSTAETNIDSGEYVYDVALQRSNGELEPIIGCSECNVLGSVVRSG